MPRITKSRDPILASLRAEHMAVLDASRFIAFDSAAWDALIDRENETRRAVRAREAMFRPRRVRKAERKAGWLGTIVRYVGAQPAGFRNHVPATALAISEAARAAHYREELIGLGLFMQYDSYRETITAARSALEWAAFHRRIAAECGRRLP